jgi:hypothetical protein
MATTNTPVRSQGLSSEFGSGRGRWDAKGAITRESIRVTQPAVDAVITLPTSQASGYTFTVQLNDCNGNAIDECQDIEATLYADAAGLALATTGGSTGLAASGASTGIIKATVVAKKVFMLRTNAAGLFSGTWTDNASEACYLGIRLPNGRTVFSPVLTAT